MNHLESCIIPNKRNILTSHTTMASWLIPLRPCCVNMQEARLFPLVKILLGKDDKWWREMTWSENVLLALFCPQNPISKQDGVDTISPLLLLLQVLRLLVETQQPICSAPEHTHQMGVTSSWFPFHYRAHINCWDCKSGQLSKQSWVQIFSQVKI